MQNNRKKFYKGLKKNSFNHKVFSILAYLLSESAKTAAKDVKDLLDFFGEYTTTSIVQKVHGTYYANLEKSMPTGKEMREAAIRNAIKKLELLDYIKTKKDKEQFTPQRNSAGFKFKISLTKKGAQEYLKYKIEKKKKKKWDSKWRIIIFDILENKRQIRDLLRRRLRWFGFKELQKSVWVFPYDVEKETKEILEVCNIDIIGDVKFLTVEKMTDDEDLKIEFGLKKTNIDKLRKLG